MSDDRRPDLRSRIADLTPEQRALVRAKLSAKGVPGDGGAIPRRTASGAPPLSFGQHGVWLAEQIRPSVGSNLLMAIRLTGPLDTSALRRSIRRIVERHEVLRTTFDIEADRPVQIVHPPDDVPLPITDLSELPGEEREAHCRELAVAEVRRPLDLRLGPLIRPRLVRLSDTQHMLLTPVHHIVFDGWSYGIFVDELAKCYAAYREGQAPSLPDLMVQYGDFAEWQQSWMQTPDAERQLSYWKEHLGGQLPTLELPTDRPRPSRVAHLGARELAVIPPDLLADLKVFGQRQGVTMFMILLASLQVLLGRYSGQDDVIVGSSIMKRSRADIYPLIGFFINMLPLRIDLSGTPTFAVLLQRVRETAAGAFAHSDMPYDRLVAALELVRDPSRNTLLQAEFELLPPLEAPREAAGLRIELVDMDPGIVWTDLDVTAWEESRGLVVAALYNPDLFEAATIQRLLGHYRVLLEAIVDDPERSIDGISLLTPPERTQLASWNETRREYDPEVRLHELVEAQATRTPDAVAVTCEQGQLTYAELDRRANQLARHLQERGVGPEVLVGICLERSVEMVVGLLGVLKAGGAYLPLDQSHPAERLGFMLADAQVSVLLTEAKLRGQVSSGEALVICLDADWQAISQQSTGKPSDQANAQNLAYVIYTSGSTGQPKGVEIPHRAVVNFLGSMHREPGLTDRDTLLAVTTLSFDISVLELFLPLSVGARVAIVGSDAAGDGAQLMAWITASEATVMQATPTTWRLLFQSGWKGSDTLKVLCGGEALPRDLAKELIQRCGSVWNMYGPTETTIWSTCDRLTDPAAPVVIGRLTCPQERYHILC